MRSKGKWRYTPPGVPPGGATLQVGFEALGGLVAVLGVFRQQFHDGVSERPGNVPPVLAQRWRLDRNVAVDPFHRIGGAKRQPPRKHLVECNAQRIEVAAGIDRPVHASRLLGRHVGKCSCDSLGRIGGLAFARKRCSKAEARELCPGGAIGATSKEYVFRLNVLVHHTLPVECPLTPRLRLQRS